VIRSLIRILVGSALSARVPVAAQRRWMQLLGRLNRIPDAVTATQLALGGVPAELIESSSPALSSDRSGSILYLHGGAYVIESPVNVRPATVGLALSTGARVYSLDYRLAPEHPMPAAIDDAISAYRALAERADETGPVAIAGDSAGGGLALATALRAREEGLPRPAALGLLCPWLDLTLSGASMRTKRGAEPVLTRAWLADCAGKYVGGAELADPRASPMFADLAELPPTLVQTATDDPLLSDAEGLAERARAVDVALELDVHRDLWHVFQLDAGLLRSADAAIARLAAFLQRALS
jgi:monoterpene epsilon-lactone hydrolase